MKKFFLLAAASLMLGGAAFAQDAGGLGVGILAEAGKNFKVGSSIRWAGFFDMGWQLVGPVHTGVQLYLDAKRLSQTSSDFSQTDITVIGLGDDDWLAFSNTSHWKATTTLTDLDFSPRATISVDVLDKAQLMAYAGLNYNWLAIDYTIKNLQNSTQILGSHTYDPYGEYTNTTTVDQGEASWNVVAGLRGTLDIFYLEYTRFLAMNDSGDYSWSQFNKDRFSFGLNFRF